MVKVLSKLRTIINFAVLSITDLLAISKSAKVSKNTLLLVRIDAIGDYVLFRNFIEILKKSEKYRDYKITLCGNVAFKELAETLDKEFINDFIWINRRSFIKNIFYRYNNLKAISKRGFEVAIQPTFSRVFFNGDAIVRASNAKERIGSQGDCSNIHPWQKRLSDRWYTHLVPASPKPMMEICRNTEFVRNLGLTLSYAELPVIDVADEMRRDIKEDEYYIICPGAGLAKRCWPLERFAQLAEKIYTTTGWLGVICGGKDEEELGQRLTSLSRAPLYNIVGKTSLSNLVHIVNKAQLLVANETGSVHIATAVGTPVVCILGGGHDGRFMPYQIEKETTHALPIAVTHKMPCFGCNWQCKHKTNRTVPFPCIRNVSVEDAWIEVRSLIERVNIKLEKS